MPVKRRQPKCRLDHLDPDHRVQLETGHNYFGGPGSGFENDAHRRAVWLAHRDTIMAEWNLAGRRPHAYWDFDQPWPAGAVSESHAVHLLPDTSAEERAAIERAWIRSIVVAVGGATTLAQARGRAADAGVPGAFFDRHGPRFQAEDIAERREFWARPSGNSQGNSRAN
jgi:hypothetical protein